MRSRLMSRFWLVLLIPVALAAVAACGGGSSGKESTGGTLATQTAGGAAAAGAASTQITVVATDNKFDKTALTVPVGKEVTVTFENKGSAIHNWHLQGVKDKNGKDITTQLIAGGKTETVSFVIDKAGTYEYMCDVHPEMRGKLTVQ
jgi:plastocyanin